MTSPWLHSIQRSPGRSFGLCVAVLFLILLGGCEGSPEDARFKLGQLGYQFSPFSLLLAASENDHVAVKLLILAGMDPDTVLDDDVVDSEYRRLGTSGPDTWSRLRGSGHTTALGVAAILGHTETVRVLLQAGADPEKRDSEDKTPLMWAMENGHTETAEALLDADAEIRDEDFERSVTVAASNNDVVMLNLLMDLGIGVSIRNEVSVTALIEAASAGSVDVVSVLIESGTDVDAQREGRRGDETETALILACRRNNVDVVRLLLDAGADPNVRNSRGRTALMVASMSGRTEIVRLLLDAGADPNAADNDSDTALAMATAGIDSGLLSGLGREDPHADTVRLLLDAGADPDQPGGDGISPFMTALEEDNVAVIDAMLEARADADVQDESGNNLLMQALISRSDADLIESLIQRTADAGRIDHQNEDGITALMIAASRAGDGPLRALLAAGADPHIRTASGVTALMRAARQGLQGNLTLLLEAGADPTVKTSRGETALDQVGAGANKPMSFTYRVSQDMKRVLRDAMNRWQTRPAAASPNPAATPTPAAGPVLEIEGGPDDGLAQETYLGGMKRRGMKVYGLSKDGNWCAENVVFRVKAPSADVYTDGTTEFYMKRFGEKINEDQFCPAAQSADIYGYTDAGTEPVFTGKASAATGWAMN